MSHTEGSVSVSRIQENDLFIHSYLNNNNNNNNNKPLLLNKNKNNKIYDVCLALSLGGILAPNIGD